MGVKLLTIIGLLLFVYNLFIVFKTLQFTIPFLDLVGVSMGLQWVFMPALEYSGLKDAHYKYHMYVDEYTYMSYVVPCYLFFLLAIRGWKRIPLDRTYAFSINKVAYFLFFLGYLAKVSSFFLSLGLAGDLLSYCRYSGFLMLLLSEHRNKRLILVIYLLDITYSGFVQGMFGSVILWGLFLVLYLGIGKKWKFLNLLLGIYLVVQIVTTIQLIKPVIRASRGNYVASVQLFSHFLVDQITLQSASDGANELSTRINQGWIISSILNYTPRYQEFAYGSTVSKAVYAALLPRFLNPNKAVVGSADNVIRYGGLQIQSGTSMGMSLAGEGYANYGYYGGIIFLFLWGYFLKLIWNLALAPMLIKHNSLVWSLLPIIFVGILKAETELLSQLNHFVKAAVVVSFLVYLSRTYSNYVRI